MTPAQALTNALLCRLVERGCYVWRENSGTARAMHGNGVVHLAPRGTPDIIGYRLSDGRMVAVEVKAGNDRIRPEQDAWLAKARKAGVLCGVARCVEDVDFILAQ